MAENSLTDRTGTGENRPTFKDPLHVNDPLLNAIDDAENDAFDIEVLPSYLVFQRVLFLMLICAEDLPRIN